MERIEAIYQWGINVIKVIQTIENPPLTTIIVFITTLGAGIAYVAMLFYIFWCVDDRQGIKLSVLMVFSGWINSFLKVLFKQPRPYNLDPSVGRAAETSYGIPSGHAQSSLVFFTAFASWLKKPALYVAAILITLVISFTRLYLGVHFPTDIFGGWIVGLVVLVLYWAFAGRIEKVLEVASLRFRLIISAAVSFIMLLLNPQDLVMPGIFLGQTMGYALMVEKFPFDVRRTGKGEKPGIINLIIRYFLGLVFTGIVLCIAIIAIRLFDETSNFYRLAVFIGFALAGAAVTCGAPWLFLKTGLAGAREKAAPAVTGGPVPPAKHE